MRVNGAECLVFTVDRGPELAAFEAASAALRRHRLRTCAWGASAALCAVVAVVLAEPLLAAPALVCGLLAAVEGHGWRRADRQAGKALRRVGEAQARAEDERREWVRVLLLLESHGATTAQAGAVRELWCRLERRDPTMPPPAVERAPEGALELTWNRRGVTVVASVTEHGEISWEASAGSLAQLVQNMR